MEAKQNINKKIQETLNSFDTIEQVKVSPFFKDKAMRRLFEQEHQVKSVFWSWFTPQLQLATLICIVALNVFALLQTEDNGYDSELSDFAESYGLSVESSINL